MNGPGDAGLEQGRIVSTHQSNSVQSRVTNADHRKAKKKYRYIAYRWCSGSSRKVHKKTPEPAVMLRRSAAAVSASTMPTVTIQPDDGEGNTRPHQLLYKATTTHRIEFLAESRWYK